MTDYIICAMFVSILAFSVVVPLMIGITQRQMSALSRAVFFALSGACAVVLLMFVGMFL